MVGAVVAWSEQLVDRLGYLRLAAVMLLESMFPPLPSEPFLLAAGLSSAEGRLSGGVTVVAAASGSTMGATVWYYAARAVSEPRVRSVVRRHGRWLGVKERDLDRALGLFARHRRLTVFTGRFLPVGRMVVSLPAGTTAMPLPEFLLATALGSAVWAGAVVTIGRVLGRSGGLDVLARYDTAVTVGLAVVLTAGAALLLARGLRRSA